MSDDPREALLAVAREIVAKRGYVGLSMRTASAAAGVTEDVALRYYRNREALFAAAMRLPVDPVSAIPALMAPGIEGMGERLVRFTLNTLRDPAARDDLISLARTGVSAGQAVTGLQDFIETGVVDRVAGMIGVPDARMRSALITSYLMGVATMRYGVRLEPLASASDEEVIRMVAPVIQDLLDPRRPIPGSARARARASSSSTGTQSAPPTGARTRTFDPDPAATRAAEAARLATEVARAAPRTSAAGPAGAVTRPASTPQPARPATARPASSKAATTKAATRAATTKASTKVVAKASTITTGSAPAASESVAQKPAAEPPTNRPPTKKATAKKATAKKSPTKKATTRASASAPAQGPKHARASAEPSPSKDQAT